MQEDERLQNLIEEALALGVRECLADFLHVFLQIILEPLKDEIELVLGE